MTVYYFEYNGAPKEEYIALGTYTDHQDAPSLYFPEKGIEAWQTFFERESYTIQLIVLSHFIYEMSVNETVAEDLPLPTILAESFTTNLDTISKLLSNWYPIENGQAPFFRFLDGTDMALQVVDEEELEDGSRLITFDSEEQLLLPEEEEHNQFFIPVKRYENLKEDMGRIRTLLFNE